MMAPSRRSLVSCRLTRCAFSRVPPCPLTIKPVWPGMGSEVSRDVSEGAPSPDVTGRL